MSKEGKEEKVTEVITAVYKVNLHCPECASKIKRPLLKTFGVHEVNTDLEGNEIKVKGRIDAQAMGAKIKRLIKRDVELVVPKAQPKSEIAAFKQKTTVNESKDKEGAGTQKAKGGLAENVKNVKSDLKVHTTTFKVHYHCRECGRHLRRKLIKRRDIYDAKVDMDAQTLTVEGVMEPGKLLPYLQKRWHKHAEVITAPTKGRGAKEGELKKGTKDEVKKMSVGLKEDKNESKVEGKMLSVEKEGKGKSGAVKEEGMEMTSEGEMGVAAAGGKEKENIIKLMNEPKNVMPGVRDAYMDGTTAPYFIHFVYAPQLFSDENPNACSIM